MPNTFLNTGRTVAATSNPVNNVNQVSNNPVNQVQTSSAPAVSNAQTQANTQVNSQASTSAISPITIPIQIQPQIASSTPVQNNTSNMQNLQANNTNVANSAPTPQVYDPSTTNTNVIDFNQIYESYQSQYGNKTQTNTNVGTSGIKKTSLGTTIVTPTTSNLNSVKGQYQSAYADSVNGLLSELITQIESMNNGTFYDPSKDAALQMAAEYAANSTMQSMASAGVLNSSMTAERVARVVSSLIPEYEKLAYDRQYQYLSQLASTAQLVMQYDSQQFEYWKDAKDREFQNKQFEYQKKQDELENAWKRVDELGYVDNEAAAILGVKAGTLSGEARLAKEQQEFELQKMREQLEIERANDEALYRLRAELDKEYANYEYELANKYSSSVSGGSSSSSSAGGNYSRYDDIIKNAYATQDAISGQYYIDGEENYKKLQAYLENLYTSGQISATELSQLSAKYSRMESNTDSNNTNASSSSTENNEYIGLTDDNKEIWKLALDGNNSALKKLGVDIYGQKMSHVNNTDRNNAVEEALKQIKSGKYVFKDNQELMTYLKNGYFGKLGWGL